MTRMACSAVPAPDGRDIILIELRNRHGTSATFMDWGATWLSCIIPMPDGAQREALLQCASMTEHLAQSAYLGASIGRFANRINKGQFQVNGAWHQLHLNDGSNTLHGGPQGFSHRRWRIEQQSSQAVEFSLLSTHGDQGFPGNLRVTVRYVLQDDNTVVVEFSAATDAVTPVSLTNHAYFNLGNNQNSVLQHSLRVDADRYLPVDPTGIPSGTTQSVAQSRFDFRRARAIHQAAVQPAGASGISAFQGYDHAFVLNQPAPHRSTPSVSLSAADNQLSLHMNTDMPALQVYTGNHLDSESYSDSRKFARYSGIALETAFLPDAPNRQELPSCFISPDNPYRSSTHFQFVTSSGFLIS